MFLSKTTPKNCGLIFNKVFSLKEEVDQSVSHKNSLGKDSKNYFNSKLYQPYCSFTHFISRPPLLSMETNLIDKVPRLQLRVIDMVRTWQLVGKAVVIIEFNPHADGTAEVSRMKQLSKYNGADVHWFNEDTEKGSLNACQTKQQRRRIVISLIPISYALGLEKSKEKKLETKGDCLFDNMSTCRGTPRKDRDTHCLACRCKSRILVSLRVFKTKRHNFSCQSIF